MKKDINWSEIPFTEYPLFTSLSLVRTNYIQNKERVYRDAKGRYYHKDRLHGEVEVYDKKGKHLDVYTPEGKSHPKKGMVRGRDLKLS
ncbi:colicin E3/pyocin S6 family cytotoxin [Paenibacillus lutrae]|uniref:Colicin E3-like ribonuclease domain-containing protein n=1 Tax=Paenibacillus lutrae TaxID=2078573 RepID=A0A7X3FLV0_9BACL|nr:colicin E3/pyocin S6 family cytotoxin [Paenibacillus lutrae]MVP02120.1 hypothetical protein [Paenibacillus lutrae]